MRKCDSEMEKGTVIALDACDNQGSIQEAEPLWMAENQGFIIGIQPTET